MRARGEPLGLGPGGCLVISGAFQDEVRAAAAFGRPLPYLVGRTDAEAWLDNVVPGNHNGLMTVVGIRELKARLSEYVRRVRGGEEVLVTDRGEVVATLLPPEAVRAVNDLEPGIRRLVAQGRLVPGRGNDPARYPVFSPLVSAGTAAAWIAEDREER